MPQPIQRQRLVKFARWYLSADCDKDWRQHGWRDFLKTIDLPGNSPRAQRSKRGRESVKNNPYDKELTDEEKLYLAGSGRMMYTMFKGDWHDSESQINDAKLKIFVQEEIDNSGGPGG